MTWPSRSALTCRFAVPRLESQGILVADEALNMANVEEDYDLAPAPGVRQVTSAFAKRSIDPIPISNDRVLPQMDSATNFPHAGPVVYPMPGNVLT